MTKKDYIAIANILKDFKNPDNKIYQAEVNEDDFNTLVNRFSKMFKVDNSNFDEYRFIEYINSNKKHKDFTDR